MSDKQTQKRFLQLATRWLFLLVLAALTVIALAVVAILDKHGYSIRPAAMAILIMAGLVFLIIVLSKRSGQP